MKGAPPTSSRRPLTVTVAAVSSSTSIGRKDGGGGGGEGDGGGGEGGGGEGKGGGVGDESVGGEGEGGGGEGKGVGAEGVGGEKGGEGGVAGWEQQPRVTPPVVGQQSPARLEHPACNSQAAIAIVRLPPRSWLPHAEGCGVIRSLSPLNLKRASHEPDITPLLSKGPLIRCWILRHIKRPFLSLYELIFNLC